MSTNSEDIGIASEAMVEKALITLMKERSKLLDPPIENFVHAKRHSPLDRAHKDFVVFLKNGERIPLQVKSSVRGMRKFMKRNNRFGRFIPTVVVEANDDLQSIIRKVVDCIRNIFNKVHRKIEWEIHLRRIRHTKKSQCIRQNWVLACH